MNNNRCVCCGTIIPEGTQICLNCQVQTIKRVRDESIKRHLDKKRKERKNESVVSKKRN